MSDRSGSFKLSETSFISVSLFLSLIAFVALAATWASNVTFRLDAIEGAIRSQVDDRWRGADMKAWVELANREVEVWSLATEQKLELEPGTYPRFRFPEPKPGVTK